MGKPVTPRWVLQYFGTDVMRDHFAKDVWIWSIEKRLASAPGPVVITDVRFPNEAEWIRSHGGEVWFVERDPIVDVSPHESEAGLPEALVDWWIDNSGRPEQTREAVIEALARK